VGPEGHVIGVDMTPTMLERVRESARAMGLANVDVRESLIETLPIEDASVDVVISNGVIDLVPDKEAVFAEIDRVLRPGGRLQIADVVISNGVIDLVPDKEPVFAEIDRVLRPGGRLQVADVIIHTEVSEDARARIDLWTG
jgi:ubiquinone/menaquinone biosynthesis C-methylase UbiE